MNTKELRKKFCLRQEDLSVIFGIPIRTITNWDNKNCMPAFTYRMMYNLLKDAWICYNDQMWHETFYEFADYLITHKTKWREAT